MIPHFLRSYSSDAAVSIFARTNFSIRWKSWDTPQTATVTLPLEPKRDPARRQHGWRYQTTQEPAEGSPSSAGSCVPAIGYPLTGAPVRWQGGRKARMKETPAQPRSFRRRCRRSPKEIQCIRDATLMFGSERQRLGDGERRKPRARMRVYENGAPPCGKSEKFKKAARPGPGITY